MYNGYRVKINEVIVSDNLISQGSYTCLPVRRVLDSYYDGLGVLHEELSKHVTVEISFSLRERSMEEQALLKDVFAKYENIQVEYWDDVSMMYKSGVFKMTRPAFSHRNTRGGKIRYKKTAIVLKEY